MMSALPTSRLESGFLLLWSEQQRLDIPISGGQIVVSDLCAFVIDGYIKHAAIECLQELLDSSIKFCTTLSEPRDALLLLSVVLYDFF